jgi:mediator of RNA polymerase II transcription subunit 12
MTSRPSLSNQRQPQRSLSGSAMLQRSALQRSGSHQHAIASSLRNNENFVDLTLDGNEIQQVRQLQSTLGTPRQTSAISIGRKDTAASSPVPIQEGPEQVAAQPPRGRPDALSHLYHNSKSLVDSTGSIHTSIGAATHEVEKTAIPLPLRPSRVRIPCIQASKADSSSSSKKDPRPRPYVLEVPLSSPHYPQNGKEVHSCSAVISNNFKGEQTSSRGLATIRRTNLRIQSFDKAISTNPKLLKTRPDLGNYLYFHR